MKNLKAVSRKSQETNRLPLYYSFATDAVYTTPGDPGNRRFYVTDLIRPNTEKEIEDVVTSWKSM